MAAVSARTRPAADRPDPHRPRPARVVPGGVPAAPAPVSRTVALRRTRPTYRPQPQPPASTSPHPPQRSATMTATTLDPDDRPGRRRSSEGHRRPSPPPAPPPTSSSALARPRRRVPRQGPPGRPGPGHRRRPRPHRGAPRSGATAPADWADIVPELGPRDGDIVVTKQQWGAFYGTDLDLQLRRRGVTQVVLTGIATSIGVESTARAAHEHGYHVTVVTDAVTDMDGGAHRQQRREDLPAARRDGHHRGDRRSCSAEPRRAGRARREPGQGASRRRPILFPSHTSGSYLRSTARSFSGISALSVILMCSGHTSVQHLVMLQ